MSSSAVASPGTSRPELETIAEALPQRFTTLTRLFLKRANPQVSRVEGSVLAALAERSHRITDLACREAISQPGITLLVNRLEARGWVTREADPHDRRAVLVTLTAEGREVLERLRAEYRALMQEELATLEESDVRTLARTIEILDRLIERLGTPAEAGE